MAPITAARRKVHSAGLVIRKDIHDEYADLFYGQSVNGRRLDAADLIDGFCGKFRPLFAQALAARRDFLRAVTSGRARYGFTEPRKIIEDADGKRRTTTQIRQGMADAFLGRPSLAWRLNATTPIPAEIMRPGLQGTGPFDDLGMAMGAINAGAYGATSWMADWEDAGNDKADNLYRAWRNLKELLAGQWDGRTYHHPTKNKDYSIRVPRRQWPVLFHRVPGIHLHNRQMTWKGGPVPAILPALILHTLNNYDSQTRNGSGVYFYVPKIETPGEAQLVAVILKALEEAIGAARGTIKIEMLNERARYAAHQELILWVLRDWLVGPNVGRWDYINSRIEMLKDKPAGVFPDPHTVGMAEFSMTEYTRRNALLTALVGGFPVGGMSAVMKNPNSPPEINASAVRSIWFDKLRERLTGLIEIDGRKLDLYRQSWVATTEEQYVRAGSEPLQAPIAALAELAGRLTDGERRKLQELGLLGASGKPSPRRLSAKDIAPAKLFSASARAALFRKPAGPVSEKGLRYAVYMASEYMFQQLNGNNAAAIDDYLSGTRLMNDFATYEIFWHWLWTALHHGARLTEAGESTRKGERVTPKLMDRLLNEREAAVREYFAKQDREGVKSRFDRAFAPVTMEILRRQIFHPEWITYGSRVLLSVIETSPRERATILDAIFSRSRAQRPKNTAAVHDFVYDIFPARAGRLNRKTR